VSARRYLDAVLPLLERLGTDLHESITQAGAAIAESLLAGGRVWVAQTSHCLSTEATNRAGGFMAVHVLHDPVVVEPPDCVIEGTPVGTSNLAVETALRVKQRGATLIALTGVAFEHDPHTVLEHPSCRRLHEIADIVVDLDGPIGDGVFTAGHPEIAVIPHSGVTEMTAMWMIFAEAMATMQAAGRPPHMYQCVMVEGARARNEARLDAYVESGLGYEDEPAHAGAATGAGTQRSPR
jgi:uncharacterized phosphosugar-binding protein